MSSKNLLNKARNDKNDEFYTRIQDIENELKFYRQHFKDKIILCNCDDPYESNFFKYFAMNFNDLGLKKLIATCYNGSPVGGTQLSLFDEDNIETTKEAHKIIINEVKDYNKDGVVNLFDIEYLLKNKKNVLTKLKGNGDFRSPECIELLKEADVIVTNPPFSLFREYVAQLEEHKKKYLIIGNQNAVSYKEFFPLIKENRIWMGYTSPKEFILPKAIDNRKNISVNEKGVIIAKFGNVCWFTNLEISKRKESLLEILYKKYNKDEFLEFDNYNAINVNKVSEIPTDYFGAMGVPLSFLDKFNPDEFEILNANDFRKTKVVPVKKHGLIKDKEGAINGKPTYVRILIRRKR